MAPDAVWGLQLVRCGHNDRGYYCTLFPVGVHHPLPACVREKCVVCRRYIDQMNGVAIEFRGPLSCCALLKSDW